jgi:hypothetical protein
MPGKLDKRADREAQAAGNAVQIIDVLEHKPCRIPSVKWQELIKRVWKADPLLCPKCSPEMRIVALIDDQAVIEWIPRHLRLWQQSVRVFPARMWLEPVDWVIEQCLDDPFSDYDSEPVIYANGWALTTFGFLYYAFMILNLNKVYIHSPYIIMTNLNINSRFGFELEGVFLEDLKVGDQRQDVVRMALFKSLWLQIFSVNAWRGRVAWHHLLFQ